MARCRVCGVGIGHRASRGIRISVRFGPRASGSRHFFFACGLPCVEELHVLIAEARALDDPTAYLDRELINGNESESPFWAWRTRVTATAAEKALLRDLD